MFENPRRGRQARNFTTNAPKILDLKSSSEQIFSRKLPLGAPESCTVTKTILDKASVYQQERLWRRDFDDGAKLRCIDLERGASHTGLVLCHTLVECELLFGPSRK